MSGVREEERARAEVTARIARLESELRSILTTCERAKAQIQEMIDTLHGGRAER